VLPVEITHEAPRITAYDETTSTKALQDDVDALDEARDVALAEPHNISKTYKTIIAVEFVRDLSW
jgi:hypothetical protein